MFSVFMRHHGPRPSTANQLNNEECWLTLQEVVCWSTTCIRPCTKTSSLVIKSEDWHWKHCTTSLCRHKSCLLVLCVEIENMFSQHLLLFFVFFVPIILLLIWLSEQLRRKSGEFYGQCEGSRSQRFRRNSPRLRDTGTLFLSEPCSLVTSQDTPLLRMSAVACRVKVLTNMWPSTDTDCHRGGSKHRVNEQKVTLQIESVCWDAAVLQRDSLWCHKGSSSHSSPSTKVQFMSSYIDVEERAKLQLQLGQLQ